MVGPSSSHTAGAVRLGLVARALLGSAPVATQIELHGSFATTGIGHATDRALVAGLLGFSTDDERIKDALAHAATANLPVSLSAVDLGETAHPNTARLHLRAADGTALQVIGASVGGGAIEITQVDGFAVGFNAELPTLVCWHLDQSGFLARITALLACVDANIATLRTSRARRSSEAITTVELDVLPPEDVLGVMARISGLRTLRVIAPLS